MVTPADGDPDARERGRARGRVTLLGAMAAVAALGLTFAWYMPYLGAASAGEAAVITTLVAIPHVAAVLFRGAGLLWLAIQLATMSGLLLAGSPSLYLVLCFLFGVIATAVADLAPTGKGPLREELVRAPQVVVWGVFSCALYLIVLMVIGLNFHSFRLPRF